MGTTMPLRKCILAISRAWTRKGRANEGEVNMEVCFAKVLISRISFAIVRMCGQQRRWIHQTAISSWNVGYGHHTTRYKLVT